MSQPNASGPRRALGIADIMILFAATAVALVWLRKPLEYRLTFISDGRIIDNLRPSTLVGSAWNDGPVLAAFRPFGVLISQRLYCVQSRCLLRRAGQPFS